MFPLCYLYRCAQTRGARLLANQPPQLSNFRLVYHQNSREDKGDPSPACWWASSLQPQLSGFPSSILQQGCGDAAQRIVPSRPPSAPPPVPGWASVKGERWLCHPASPKLAPPAGTSTGTGTGKHGGGCHLLWINILPERIPPSSPSTARGITVRSNWHFHRL